MIGPADWPNPVYPDPPEIVVEREPAFEVAVTMTGFRTDVELPEAGWYRVTAIAGDGGCFDTAAVSDGGNAPIDVDDGDTVRLTDTGEVCD